MITKSAIYARDVEVGDTLDLGTYVAHVAHVRTLWLAEPATDATIRTSFPESGHRWPVMHISTEYGGIVRFGHEWVERIS